MFVESSSQFPSPAMWVVIVIAFIALVIYGEQLIQMVTRLIFNAIKIGMFLALVVAVFFLLSRAKQSPVPTTTVPSAQPPTTETPTYERPQVLVSPLAPSYQQYLKESSP